MKNIQTVEELLQGELNFLFDVLDKVADRFPETEIFIQTLLDIRTNQLIDFADRRRNL